MSEASEASEESEESEGSRIHDGVRKFFVYVKFRRFRRILPGTIPHPSQLTDTTCFRMRVILVLERVEVECGQCM